MEPIFHTVYFSCGNLLISVKGEAFGTAVKKDIGQFSLYFMSHKLNIIGFFRNCKCKFPFPRSSYPLHLLFYVS